MNRCVVWPSTDATPGQIVGFGREVIVPVSKTYYIGLAADNYMSLEVNSVLIKAFPAESIADHFTAWHLFPVFLNAGSNLIHIVGYNDTIVAGIGAEIYDATLAELQGVATISALDARTIFSTKSLIGSYAEEGNFGIGYTCPEGYSLINRSGVYSCDRVTYGAVTINNHDVVGFKKGTTDEFVVTTDPLDPTLKTVEIPSDRPFDIILPNAVSVAARCVTPTSIPSGWTVAADVVNPNDLMITHGLGRKIANVTVFKSDANGERQLFGNLAFSGIIAPTSSVLKIEGLATTLNPIIIHLIFS
jgi:hypothetical protein